MAEDKPQVKVNTDIWYPAGVEPVVEVGRTGDLIWLHLPSDHAYTGGPNIVFHGVEQARAFVSACAAALPPVEEVAE